MAIETKLANGYWVRKLILTALFFLLGLWGVYDGWYLYPKQMAEYGEYQEYLRLDEKRRASNGLLIGAEQTRWNELDARFASASQPKERTSSDIAVQRWGVVPVCFGLALAFAVTWALSARRRYVYHDDGSLTAPEGQFPAERMTGLDMTRWQSKSIALLEIDGGPKGGGRGVKLDAWIYAGLEDVIDALDRRFHPEEYAQQPAASRDAAPAATAAEAT